MTGKSAADLRAEFGARHAGQDKPAQEVPEEIRRHAPKPVLRPGGSWAARADAVDRQVREQEAARKAKNEWAARLKECQKQGKGFRR